MPQDSADTDDFDIFRCEKQIGRGWRKHMNMSNKVNELPERKNQNFPYRTIHSTTENRELLLLIYNKSKTQYTWKADWNRSKVYKAAI